MKLSLKQKALAQTTGVVVLSCAIAAIVAFIITNVSPAVVGTALVIVLFAFFGYMFYNSILSNLEWDEKLKDMNKKD
jgi:hypothetical protein